MPERETSGCPQGGLTESTDPLALLDRLLSEEGRAVLDALPGGALGPDEALRLGTRLRGRHPAELVAAALAQHDLRARAAGKFAAAGRMWFTREGLEQASAEPLARHRATRYAQFAWVADLCCGIGGDLCGLAPGRGAVAVDLDPVHLRMARENARVHGAGQVAAACADVRDLRLPASLAVFVDPARRVGGGGGAAGSGGGGCRRGRAGRRSTGAWGWPGGWPRSGSRPPPASPSSWSRRDGRWSCWPTGGSSRRRCCGRRSWPPPPAGPRCSPGLRP